MSSRKFDQDTSQAKKAADDAPVFIMDRGKPTYVLLSIEEYRRLTGGYQKIADLLAMPGMEEIELEIPTLRDLPQPVAGRYERAGY